MRRRREENRRERLSAAIIIPNGPRSLYLIPEAEPSTVAASVRMAVAPAAVGRNRARARAREAPAAGRVRGQWPASHQSKSTTLLPFPPARSSIELLAPGVDSEQCMETQRGATLLCGVEAGVLELLASEAG